ncbi:MAG: cysteine protease StiP family protein [Clostridiales bacterium]
MSNHFNKVKYMKYKKIGSYSEQDVVFLLKDLSNLVKEQGNEEREGYIQGGKHYSEMIPIEHKPSKEYMNLFYDSLNSEKTKIARAVAKISEVIFKKNGSKMVIVSLARAGTPAGILIKRYLEKKYSFNLPHYSVSIIRGRGIDENALLYILDKNKDHILQFIDGWTGKGAILTELSKACNDFEKKYKISLDDSLAVIADPGHCTNLYGTREDFLLPSACLNSTVSGLVSRTILRRDLMDEFDFHGVKYYKELKNEDVSNLFINEIVEKFDNINLDIENITNDKVTNLGMQDVNNIKKEFGINDVNLIKPGVGETTRVLLRRIPWKILIKNKDNKDLKHILLLAKEKKIEIINYPLMCYHCCGIIKPLRDIQKINLNF